MVKIYCFYIGLKYLLRKKRDIVGVSQTALSRKRVGPVSVHLHLSTDISVSVLFFTRHIRITSESTYGYSEAHLVAHRYIANYRLAEPCRCRYCDILALHRFTQLA